MKHLTILLLLPLLLPIGCGKESKPTRPPDPVPARMVISPPSGLLTAIGQTLQLTARLLDTDGNTLAGYDIAWSSSAAAVATVDRNGQVTARSDGTTRIIAAWGGVQTNVKVTVARSPARIILAQTSALLTSQGETITLTAVIEDSGGTEIPDAPQTWTSEDPDVASVDDQGVVTAHMTGTTRITVTSGMITTGVVVTVEDVATDRELLVEFYNATGGPDWKNNTNWLTDMPLSEWHGIDTDSTGRVEVIWLLNNGLKGDLPASLASLSHLEVLALSDSELGGTIPEELGNLKSLRRLILTYSKISGNIPSSLGNLSELTTLDFQFNQLTGEIPSSLGSLANLAYLRLTGNPMHGPIPPSLGQLDKLQWLYLSGSGLTGAIPAEFGGLASLKEIWMAGNNLTGDIPAALGRLEHLISIDLHDNAGMQGPLPRTFLNLNLVYLRLFETQICLPRDLEFQEWKFTFHDRYVMDCEAGPELTALEAMYNWMGGENWTNNTNWRGAEPMSAWFGVSVDDSGSVVGLELPGNGLQGEIQIALGGLARLERLNLGGNALTGGIPAELGALERLKELRLNDNTGLTGALPDELVNLPLNVLWLQGTGICAPDNPTFKAWFQQIPDRQVTNCEPTTVDGVDPVDPVDPVASGDREVLIALYNSTDGPNWRQNDNWLSDRPLGEWNGVVTNSDGRVVKLELYRNELNGNIPSSLGQLSSLERLDLQQNNLSGGIPSAIGDLSHLQLLSLGDNYLTGSIPASLVNLTNLKWMYFYENDLSGGIPSSISRLSNLRILDLSGNDLDGQLPTGLGDLTELIWLKLHGNSFAGGIPTSVGGLSSLEKLNLSFNRLTGGIPSSLGNLSALKTLNLANNDLSGGLPSTLGNLSNLELLLLGNNTGLSGPLPHSLINTSLQELNTAGTDLCAPQDNQFKSWLASLNRRSTKSCPLSVNDRATLVAFYNATDGPNWRFRTNWLSNQPINEWFGVSVDSEGRVGVLSLRTNSLSESLPSSLEDLSNLRSLYLSSNDLTGGIPATLGNLTNLRDLYIHRNKMSGSIPSSLGRLENLVGLSLNDNMLTGSIPGTLGDLTNLEWLWLENNQLSGGIPASLGGLTKLKLLTVQNNEAMSGPLPGALTGLTNIDTLRLDGTSLCVPRTDAFQTWLDGIRTKQFEYCETDGGN